MPRQYRPMEVVKVLERLGWQQRGQRGSHLIMVRTGSRNNLSIPLARREVAPGTLRQILRKAGVSKQEFEEQV